MESLALALPENPPEALPTSETDASPKPKAPVKVLDNLDAVLRALSEQDEQLKAMKTQIQDLLTTNAALKRGIKQIVQDASKNDTLEEELQQSRKKLAMLKTFING
jgi:hypothetical protein